MARVLVLMGRFGTAVSMLAEIKCDEERPLDVVSTRTLLGVANICILELQCAQSLLESALALSRRVSARRFEAVCYEQLGLLESYRGNYHKAREYYQLVLDMPEPTASAVAQTLRMLTDVYIAERKFKKARATAKRAEEAICKINERIELGALHRAYGQIYTHEKDRETARDHFKKSIDLLKEIGARYELAMTYFACGQSESYDAAERAHHLEAARMLFAEMGVPRRVEQVDEAIARLRSVSVPNIITSEPNGSFPTIIAVNPQMKKIVAYASQVAKSKLNILLTGETGTGKDSLAEYIHDASGRTGKFVVVNVAAIPNEMIESELFGYKKGAFTGASDDKPGLFEAAENGTLCLNEVADAALLLQVKLLEVLERRQIRRLGENEKRSVNFRLIAASNRDLNQLMSEGRFRRDLYHRLNEIDIALPLLRDRTDDIPALVKHFLSDCEPGIKSTCKTERQIERLGAILSVLDYPGNVRELKARVSKLALSSGGDVAEMLRIAINDGPLSERELLARILDLTNWNRSHVAQIFDVSEGTIRNWIRKHRLTRP